MLPTYQTAYLDKADAIPYEIVRKIEDRTYQKDTSELYFQNNMQLQDQYKNYKFVFDNVKKYFLKLNIIT